MTVKIYNRLSEDSVGRDSKIQDVCRVDDYDTKQNPKYDITNGDGLHPISRDWFGVYLLSSNSYKLREIPDIILFTADDLAKLDAKHSKAYLDRYRSCVGGIRLNHLLNFPENILKEVTNGNLRLETKQHIMANMICHELVLRLSNPKATTASENKHLLRSPITLLTLNDLEFKEVVAHGYVDPNTAPLYLTDLLGFTRKRGCSTAIELFQNVLNLLVVTDLKVETFNSDGIGKFFILSTSVDSLKDKDSTGKVKVAPSLTPKSVVKKLPDISVLKSEMDRVDTLYGIFDTGRSKVAPFDITIDEYAKDFDGFPRKAIASTNPMYGSLVNTLSDECSFDYVTDFPFDITRRMEVYTSLLKAGLYKFEVTPRNWDYWDGITVLSKLRGLGYSDRRSGNKLKISSFISPVLSHIMGIFIAARTKDKATSISKAAWMAELGVYLKDLNTDGGFDLAETFRKLVELESFIETTSSQISQLTQQYFDVGELNGVDFDQMLGDVTYANANAGESQNFLGSFQVSDLIKSDK